MTHGFSNTDKSKKPMNMFYDFSTGKVYAYDNNEELQEVSISGGGGSMPFLNYANPLKTFMTAGALSYTAVKDCWLVGTASDGANLTVTIDNTQVVYNNANVGHSGGFVFIPIKSGQTIVCSSIVGALHVYEEL